MFLEHPNSCFVLQYLTVPLDAMHINGFAIFLIISKVDLYMISITAWLDFILLNIYE